MADILTFEVIEKALKRMGEIDEEKLHSQKTLFFPCKCGCAVAIDDEYCPRCKRVNRFWKGRIYNG